MPVRFSNSIVGALLIRISVCHADHHYRGPVVASFIVVIRTQSITIEQRSRSFSFPKKNGTTRERVLETAAQGDSQRSVHCCFGPRRSFRPRRANWRPVTDSACARTRGQTSQQGVWQSNRQ